MDSQSQLPWHETSCWVLPSLSAQSWSQQFESYETNSAAEKAACLESGSSAVSAATSQHCCPQPQDMIIEHNGINTKFMNQPTYYTSYTNRTVFCAQLMQFQSYFGQFTFKSAECFCTQCSHTIGRALEGQPTCKIIMWLWFMKSSLFCRIPIHRAQLIHCWDDIIDMQYGKSYTECYSTLVLSILAINVK